MLRENKCPSFRGRPHRARRLRPESVATGGGRGRRGAQARQMRFSRALGGGALTVVVALPELDGATRTPYGSAPRVSLVAAEFCCPKLLLFNAHCRGRSYDSLSLFVSARPVSA